LTKTADTTQQLSGMGGDSLRKKHSSNVQSVASATEEMTSSVHEISRQVQESSNIAREAVKQARRPMRVSANCRKRRAGSAMSSTLITAVAEQTNCWR